MKLSNLMPCINKLYLCLIVAELPHIASLILITIDSGNGMLPDLTKTIPKPMSTYFQSGPVAFTLWWYSLELTKISFTKWRLHDDVIKRKHFRVTGPLWGESTGHSWMPFSKSSDARLWNFLWSTLEQTIEETIETAVIWDTTALIITYYVILIFNSG